MKNEIYPNGCAILSFDDLDYNRIAQDSLKKDLVDWCKADREKWLKEAVNTIYDELYIPTRAERFENLPDDVRNEYIEKKKVFGISCDVIKCNALIRYAIERVKMYGTKEKFIEIHGEEAFNRFFLKEAGAKLDTRWEIIEELIENGFD
jgi:hypothetical protein